MAIQVPKYTTYYYETSGSGARLVLCLTPEDLARHAKEAGVKPELVSDFPTGLDIKVSDYELKLFKEEYGLVLDLDPEALLIAFEAFRRQAEKPFPSTGFLPAEFLEDNARQIPRSRGPLRRSLKGEPPDERLRVQVGERKRIREAETRLAIRGAKKDDKTARLQIPRVEMTEGEEPGRRFRTLQQRRPRKGGE